MIPSSRIEAAILSLNGGNYQRLVEEYLAKKYGSPSPSYLGTKAGSSETTRGTPDAFYLVDDKYIFIEAGHIANHRQALEKLRKDRDSAQRAANEQDELDGGHTVSEIVLAYVCSDVTPTELDSVRNGDDRIRFLGINELAENLRCYPSLLSEYLGLSSDNDQILDFDGFKSRSARHAFIPSYSGDFVGRKEEASQLQSLIESKQAVLVSGPSGAGKTRLVLEVVHRLEMTHSIPAFYCMSSRHGYLDDLAQAVEGNGMRIVFLDDVNEFLDLRGLANFLLDHKNVRFVATVRDYEFASVKSAMEILPTSVTCNFELNRMSEENFRACLRGVAPNLTLAFIEYIWEVTHGNLRFSLMCIERLEADGFENMGLELPEVLRSSFSPLLRELDMQTVGALQIASILRHGWVNGSVTSALCEELGLSTKQYLEALQRLSDIELVQLSNTNQAFSVMEQSLRDYMVYVTLYERRCMSFVQLSKCGIGLDGLKNLADVLGRVFYSSSTSAFVTVEMEGVWHECAGLHLQMLSEFAAFLRQETVLAATKKLLDEIVSTTAGSDDLNVARSICGKEDTFLKVIQELRCEESYDAVLPRLFCDFVERTGRVDKRVLNVLKSVFSAQMDRSRGRARIEAAWRLFRELMSRLQGGISLPLGALMCSHCANLLQDEVWGNRYDEESRKATIFRGKIRYSEELFELRRRLVEEVASLLEQPDLFAAAENCLLSVNCCVEGTESEQRLTLETVRICAETYTQVVPPDRWDFIRLNRLLVCLKANGACISLEERQSQLMADVELVVRLGMDAEIRVNPEDQYTKSVPIGDNRLRFVVGSLANGMKYSWRSRHVYDAQVGVGTIIKAIGVDRARFACDLFEVYLSSGGRADPVFCDAISLEIDCRGWKHLRELVLSLKTDDTETAAGNQWLTMVDQEIICQGWGRCISDELLRSAQQGWEALGYRYVLKINDLESSYYTRYLRVVMLNAAVSEPPDLSCLSKIVPRPADSENYERFLHQMGVSADLRQDFEDLVLRSTVSDGTTGLHLVGACTDIDVDFGVKLVDTLCESCVHVLEHRIAIANALWDSRNAEKAVRGALVESLRVEKERRENYYRAGAFCEALSECLPEGNCSESYLNFLVQLVVFSDEDGQQRVSDNILHAVVGLEEPQRLYSLEKACKHGLEIQNVAEIVSDLRGFTCWEDRAEEPYEAHIRFLNKLIDRLDLIEFAEVRAELRRLIDVEEVAKEEAASRQMAVGF